MNNSNSNSRGHQHHPTTFSGITSNLQFANAIKKSFANQTMTLTKTVNEEKEQLTYLCNSCNVSKVGERGEYVCCHCGGSMKEEGGGEFAIYM